MTTRQDEVDMETFQRLSDNYQPDVQGPLIRERCPIQMLMSEYNNADAAYVTKTAALASSYSLYRPIKGDGQCGWRAVIFGYFESLLSQGLAKIASEKARLQSFNDSLVAVGYDFTMVELFVDETMDLFDSLRQAMESGNSTEQLLLEAFNEENRSNSIVFHFKLLTSATMKLNPAQYEPYLEQPLFEYCQSNVDAFGQEIEQISLQALTDGVIAPAHINVIVMYLDRSQGGEVTPHHFVANAGPNWPAISLLYRPGHYDMIYKATPIRAHRVEISATPDRFISTNNLGHRLLDLRVLSLFNEDQSMMHQYSGVNQSPSSRTMNIPYPHFLAPSGEQTIMAEHHQRPSAAVLSSNSGYDPPFTHHAIMSAGAVEDTTKAYEVSNSEARYDSFSSALLPSSACFHPPMLVPSHHYSSPPATSPIPSTSPGPSPRKPELQIRLSQPCYEMGQRHHEILPLETGPFKNSPFNRGHFANPDFQPLMWNAEDDYL